MSNIKFLLKFILNTKNYEAKINNTSHTLKKLYYYVSSITFHTKLFYSL